MRDPKVSSCYSIRCVDAQQWKCLYVFPAQCFEGKVSGDNSSVGSGYVIGLFTVLSVFKIAQSIPFIPIWLSTCNHPQTAGYLEGADPLRGTFF